MFAVFLAAGLATAQAGDPCPIDLRFAEHTPSWRDRDADLAALQSQSGWYGVSYTGRTDGVWISAVAPGSPAEAAGLKVGDAVVTLNGQPVATREDANAAFDAPKAAGRADLRVRRGAETLDLTLKQGRADPLLFGMVRAAEKTPCRDARLQPLTPDQHAKVSRGAFDDQRGFRCADAHTALAPSDFAYGAVVLVRGGQRVLVTMPGWSSTCVEVASTDGAALTPARLAEVLDATTAAFVRDRHDNP